MANIATITNNIISALSGTTSQVLLGDATLTDFKLDSLTDVSVPTPGDGDVLKWNGTTSLWEASDAAGVTGSGAAGQVAYFTGATTQAGSNNLFWDATNSRLGIGTNAPSNPLHVVGVTYLNGNVLVSTTTVSNNAAGRGNITIGGTSTSILNFQINGSLAGYFYHDNNNLNLLNASGSGALLFSTNSAERARVFPTTGNFGINTGATDSGQLLQVAGTARIFGTGAVPLLVERTTATSNVNIEYKNATRSFYAGLAGNNNFSISTAATLTTGEFQITPLANVLINTGGSDTGQRLQVIGTGYFSDSVGIGSTTLTGINLRVSKTITGATTSYGILNDGVIQPDVTSIAGYNRVVMSKAAGAATSIVVGYWAVQGTYSGTVDTQYGYLVDSTLTGATNNYAYFSNIASGTGRWNLYMNGTANNYMAGSLGIGSTNLTARTLVIGRTVTGATTGYGILQISTYASDVTASAINNYSIVATAAATYTLTNAYNYFVADASKGAGSTITNQFGYYSANLTQGTNNFGFYSDVASTSGRWNFYAAGTATNYFNGNVLIGSTTDSGEKLQVTGTMKVTGATALGATTITTSNSSALFVNSSAAACYIGMSDSSSNFTYIGSDDGTFLIQTPGNSFSTKFSINSAGNMAVDTNTLFVDATANRVGIGTINPSYTFHAISADATIGAFRNSGAALGQLLVGNTAGDMILRILATGDSLIYSDTAKYLAFGSNGGTERMRIDTAGNLGLGVTPSAWYTPATSVLQVRHSSFYSQADGGNYYTFIGNNYFQDSGTFFKYINTGSAVQYRQFNGQHIWYNAPSGTANATITFTQAMTLDASGNLAVGTTTTTNRLEVWGTGNTAARIVGQSAGNATLILSSGGVTAYSIKSGNGDSSLRIDQDGSERIMLASGGNLLIGSTSDSGERLQVTGTAKITGAVSSNVVFRTNHTGTGNEMTYIGERGGGVNGGYMRLRSANVTTVEIDSAGPSIFNGGNVAFDTNTLFVDATNNRVGILTTTPSYTLDVVGSARVDGTHRIISSNSLRLTKFGIDSVFFGDIAFIDSLLISSANGSIKLGSGNPTTFTEYMGIANGGATTFINSVTSSAFIPSGATVPTNGMYLPTTNTLGWSTNTTERMRLDSSGRLGIGTTAINSNLVVYSTISDSPSTTNKGAFQIAFSTTNGLSFGTYSTSPFANYIQSISHAQGGASYYPLALNPVSGAVLINTNASTGESLQVAGTAKITGATSITNTMTARQVIVDGANNSNISRINLTRTDASWGIYNETDFRIYYSTGNTITPTTQYFSLGSGTGTATFTGNLVVDTNTLFVDATNNRVGIGTASPNYKIHAIGAASTVVIGAESSTASDILFYGLGTVTGGLIMFDSGINATGSVLGRISNTNTSTGSSYLNISVPSASSGDPYLQFSCGLDTNWSIGIDNSDSDKLKIGAVSTPSSSPLGIVMTTDGNIGFGTATPNSSVHIVGSVTKSISTKTANYTMTATDHTVLCDTNAGNITITLPAASGITGRIYVIKKINDANILTIDANASEFVEYGLTYQLECKSSVIIQCDGSNWHVIASHIDSSCLIAPN